ncbi:MAG: hypothetical protein R6V76_00960 [Desulfobacterales bacterium]
MSLYYPAKYLNYFLTILTACFLFFFCPSIPQLADPWFEQYANAGVQENKPFSQADKADFSQSEMKCPASKIHERDSVTYEIILRNTGIQPSDSFGLWFDVRTTAAMLASASPELSYSLKERMLRWKGKIRPGEEKSFVVKLITLPHSAGSIIINPVSAVWGETTNYFHCETKVLSRETKGKILFMAGRVEIGWLEIIIIGYLLLIPLFLIIVPRLIRWRERQNFEKSPDVSWRDSDPKQFVYAICITFLACLSVMLFFAFIVFEDIRKFSSYGKTTCTILDKKIQMSTGSTGKTKSPVYDPFVSVRYNVKGKEIVSADSIKKGAFLSNSETSAEKKLALYELGKSYPCWFDPEDPQEFLLKRRLSLAWYLLCIGPLILFLISSRYLLRRLRKSTDPGVLSKNPIHPG